MNIKEIRNILNGHLQPIDWVSLEALAFLGASITQNENDAAIAALLSLKNAGGRVDKAIHSLVRMQKHVIEKQLDSSAKTVAIYHTNVSYRDHYARLCDLLREKGFNVLIFVKIGKEYSKHGFENSKNVFYGGANAACNVAGIDLFIACEEFPAWPHNSKTMFIDHGPFNRFNFVNPLPAEKYINIYMHGALHYDYVLTPHTHLSELKNTDIKYFPAPLPKSALKSLMPFFCFVPGGYPKLDHLMRYLDDNIVPVDSIVYAPVWHTGSFNDMGLFGEAIIGAALDAAPSLRVVFRPHSYDQSNPVVIKLVEKFSSNPRFFYDTTPSYFQLYARTALLISDYSSTAATFSLATKRPVIYFQPDGRALKGDEGVVDAGIGAYIKTIDQLRRHIHDYLNRAAEFSAKIEAIRSERINNVGHSEEYVVDNIDYILNDSRHPDWIYINIPAVEKTQYTESDIEKNVNMLLENMQANMANVIVEAACGDHPHNQFYQSLKDLVKNAMAAK